ncbi:MAG: zinc ribbon domain-containing protein [Vicinamibacteria bacterium]
MSGEDAASPGAGEVATARDKYHCPACGAEAHWNPAKDALVCPYCGATSPATLQQRGADTVIVEHDLAAALRGLGDDRRGWPAEKTQVRCQSCQAISVLDAAKVGARCEFCGSASLVPYEQVKDAFRPESLLPLKIAEPQAREAMRRWYQGLWFAPNRFGVKAATDTVKGVYVPYWTFDAQASADWTADSGTYYWVEQGGKKERRVRWTPAAGHVDHFFDDDLVCASRGVDASLLRGIEPFPTDQLVPYDPGYLAGWVVERYQIDLVAAAQRSRQQMEAAVRAMCAQQVPGDTQRNLSVRAAYRDQTFKHILAPVWLVAYTYRGKAYQVVVNGVTGRIAGRRPWSWIKISLAVLAVIVVLVILQHLG